MLQEMRKYTKSWVSSLFLGALALSFGIWGIADIFRGNSDTTVFAIGSSQVPVEMYQRDYHNAMRSVGTALQHDQARALGQQVLDRMMLTTALDNLTDRLGLTASDTRVRAQIQSTPAFTGTLGTFDHDTFLRLIGQYGYGEDEFVAIARKDAARTQLLSAVTAGFMMPSDYAAAIFSYINELRAAEYVVLSPNAVGTIAPPPEATLAAYVKAHPERFSTPEYRAVSVAEISVDDVASTINVSDKQVQDELNLHKSEYVTPERRELEQMGGFSSEGDAKAAKAALDGGKSFEALAAERKLQPADYKLGELTQADLAIDPPRAAAAFALAEGQTSGPIKGSFGWVLVHVVKITPGTSKSTDEIRQNLRRQLAVAKITDVANAFTDAISGGAGIEEAARKAGMHFSRVASVDAQGVGAEGARVTAASNPELLAAAFKSEVGDVGDPFPTRDGEHYFAIKVDGVTPPKLKSLDAVRAQATEAWIAEQRVLQLRAKAAALTAKANADHSLSGVAAALGVTVQNSPTLNRRFNTGLFNSALVAALYNAPAGGAVFANGAGGSVVIARVSGIVHPSPGNDQLFAAGVRQLSGDIAEDITVSLAKAEQNREGTRVNQSLVDSTVGNSGTGS
jgi:peptidyl-prolyl cis-trans isomerase D